MKQVWWGLLGAVFCACAIGGGYAYVQQGENTNYSNSEYQPTLPESPISRCINLGNALDAPNEGDWTYIIKDEHVQKIAKAGFETVRLPIRWSAHTQKEAPYVIDPAFFARVEHVVNVALLNGLKVIIDVHHYEEIMQTPAAHVDRLDAMWRQISRRFRGHGENIIFEVLNEPMAELTSKELIPLNARMVATIRNNAGSDPWIMLGGDNWGNFSGLKKMRFPYDPRIIVTFHDYGPFEFTHQGASFTGKDYPTGRAWGTDRERKDVISLFSEARQFGSELRKPIFLGEFGVYKRVPESERAKWIKYYRQSAEDAGIGWCLWDFGAAFAIYDEETKSWSPPILEALFD